MTKTALKKQEFSITPGAEKANARTTSTNGMNQIEVASLSRLPSPFSTAVLNAVINYQTNQADLHVPGGWQRH